MSSSRARRTLRPLPLSNTVEVAAEVAVVTVAVATVAVAAAATMAVEAEATAEDAVLSA